MSGPPGDGISGKVVAVTGASAGIGAATVRLLAGRGARLVLGARRREPLDALRVDEWERMVDVNLKGVLFGVAAALPAFRAQGFGRKRARSCG